MSKTVESFSVFLSCPSDLNEEREALVKAIEDLNRTFLPDMGARLELVHWQTDGVPRFVPNKTPQQLIEEDIGTYDIYFGMMKHRFGTASDSKGSGTQQEFESAFQSYRDAKSTAPKSIMFLFSEEPVSTSDPRLLEQALRVARFRDQLKQRGLYGSFRDSLDLRDKARGYLAALVRDLRQQSSPPGEMSVDNGKKSDRATTASFESTIPELAKSSDRVLAISFHEQIATSRILETLENFAHNSGNIFQLHEPVIGERLRSKDFNPDDWRCAVSLIDGVVRETAKGCVGSIHLFFEGPHALGFWLGQCLDRYARRVDKFIYFHDLQRKSWVPFSVPPEYKPTRKFVPYFGPEVTVKSQEGGKGVVLSIDASSCATEQQLGQILSEADAWVIKRLPSKRRSIESLEVAMDAISTAESLMEKVGTSGHELHIVTSAPAAMAVALGTRVRSTVYPSVWFWSFDSALRQYYRTLDVKTGEVPHSRNCLKIFSCEPCIMFELNGELLRACSYDLAGSDGINPEEASEKSAFKDIKAFSRKVLPEMVEKRIEDLSQLDIDLFVENNAGALRWELLHIGSTARKFVSLTPRWTLTRFSGNRSKLNQPLPINKVRVLIVPALAEESEETYLRLKDLEHSLCKIGYDVKRLPYGVDIKQIDLDIKEYQPTILHWISHGSPFLPDTVNDVLEVQDKNGAMRLDISRFRALISGATDLRLILLCSCMAGGPTKRESLALHLLKDHPGAVIGYRDAINTGETAAFASALYDELARGLPIRDAVQLARIKIHGTIKLRFGTFAAPILWADQPLTVGPLVALATIPTTADVSAETVPNDSAPSGPQVEQNVSQNATTSGTQLTPVPTPNSPQPTPIGTTLPSSVGGTGGDE